MKKLFLPLIIAITLTSCSVSKPSSQKQPCYTIDTFLHVDMNGGELPDVYVPHLVKHKKDPFPFAAGVFTGIVTVLVFLVAGGGK
jgi:hypothetical protein